MSTRSDSAAPEQFQQPSLGDRGTAKIDLKTTGLDPVDSFSDLRDAARNAFTRTPGILLEINNPYATTVFAAVNPGVVSDATSVAQAGDQKRPEVRSQLEQQPSTDNQRAIQFGLLAQAVRDGRVSFSEVEPRLRALLGDADRSSNAALDREARDLQGIDRGQYIKAVDKVRDTRKELDQTIPSNISGENRSYAKVAAENYMVNPAGNRRALMQLDPSGKLLRDAEAVRTAQNDPTFRRVHEIQERTNAVLRDSVAFRQSLEEFHGRRGQSGDAGRMLQLRSERIDWEQVRRHDRLFFYPRPQ